MKKYGKHIISFALMLLFFLLGIVFYKIPQTETLASIFLTLLLFPVATFIVSMVFSKVYVKKLNNTKVADMHGYMLRHRNDAEETSVTLLEKLQQIRHITTCYTVFLALDAAGIAFFSGMSYATEGSLTVMNIYAAYSWLLFYFVCTRIPKMEPIVLNDEIPVLKPDEYPKIYSIARSAADALGCRKNIVIVLSSNCGASIVRDKDNYYLQLGIVLLSILSEEELYSVFLHEFSHCSDVNREADKELYYGSWLSTYNDSGEGRLFIIGKLFSFFDVWYMFNHMTYQYATSVYKEMLADADMAKHGNIKASASALLKTSYEDKYQWESGVEDEEPFYATEIPDPHYLRRHIERFKKAIEARREVWDSMVWCEILANNATHPTLKMRLETLGVEKAECIEDKSSAQYREETERALDFADKKMYSSQESYHEYRKESYLEPLQRVEKWEENGKPILAEEYADVVSDLRQLGRNKEAEALCDRAIAELDCMSSPYAYFIKGCAMIHRYDKDGVDLIYTAIEKNHNYLEAGLDQIGAFYCMTGMEAELMEYRKKAEQLAQRDKDEFSQANFISNKDNLSKDDMPDEMLDEILNYILSVGENIIQDVYLVRKTVSDNFFTSAFVIRFDGGTDEQQGEIMHKIFRYLDTYPKDWQFSLFDYVSCSDINFNKIEGSLVYQKTAQQTSFSNAVRNMKR